MKISQSPVITNLTKAFQTALKAITAPMLELDSADDLQIHLALGSEVLLAFQKIADLQVSKTSASRRLRAVIAIIAEAIHFPLGLVEQYDPETKQFRIVASHGLPWGASAVEIEAHQTLSETMVATRQPMVWTEAADPIVLPQLKGLELFDAGFQTIIGLPLISHQTIVGTLTLAHPDYQPISDYVIQWLESLAAYVAHILTEAHSEQHQIQTQERLDLAALSLGGVIYDLTLEQGQFLRTEGLFFLLGYDQSDIAPSLDWWLRLVHPDDQPAVTAFFEETIHHQQEYALTYRVRGKNNQYLAVCDRGIIRCNALGDPIRLVGTLTETVSEPMVANIASIEEPVLPAPRPIEPLWQDGTPQLPLLQSVLDSLQDVIFQIDRDGCWTFLNQAWETLTGFTVEDTLGQPYHRFIHPEEDISPQTPVLNLLDSPLTPRSYQMRYLTQTGGTRWVEVHCQPILNAQGIIDGLAGTLHDITERKTVESQLLYDAMHDSLTHLPNRVLFMDRLQHAYQGYQRHQERGFAILFLDLDRFKLINDSLGHIAGDELLKSVAERLQSCLRPEDTVARFGGDEFTILLPSITQVEEAIRVSDRILKALGRPFEVAGTEIYASASIGIALSNNPNQDPEELLRNADIALYRAKSNGKGRYELFVTTMHTKALEQLELETDLRRAIEHQEFQVYYQPIHILPNHKLAGFEALLRWMHPKRGLLPPAEFLALAEETGLLATISWWALRSACEQLQKWQQVNHLPSHIFMSVNFSPQQLKSEDFVSQVQQTLTKLRLPPHCLMIEVGENVFAEESQTAIAKLKQLKDAGIQLCLDEFGSRVSSFSDLVRLPLNQLKIDRAFVSEMQMGNNLEVVRSIITLGHKLSLRMIAEGVETESQVAQLQALKCDYGQGEFFSLAAPAENLSYLLEQQFLVDPSNMSLQSATPTLILQTPTGLSHIPLTVGKSWSMGRNTDSTVVMTDRWVSRNHAEIQLLDNGEYYLVDLGSGNGSFVNGQRVTMPVRLQEGDLLTIGRTEIEFQYLEVEVSTQIQDTSPKSVLMIQSSQRQEEIWREALSSQGISLVCLGPEIDLSGLIEQRVQAGESLPDLLLLDMTALRPNPYSFCRWCHSQYPQLKIVLTSGTRTQVPSSERQWAIYQGALDLLPAFSEENLFSNIVDIATRIRTVLTILDAHPVSQQSLASALMSIQSVMNRDTVIWPRGFPAGDLK